MVVKDSVTWTGLHFTCDLHLEHLRAAPSSCGSAPADVRIVLTQLPTASQDCSAELSLISVFHLCAKASKAQINSTAYL